MTFVTKRYIGEKVNGMTVVSIHPGEYVLSCDICENQQAVTPLQFGNLVRNKVACNYCRVGQWGKRADVKDTLYSRIKTVAKRRRIEFSISLPEFREIANEQCFYCGSRGSLKTNWEKSMTEYLCGIDRVDSSKGYVSGNCVACCGICNRAKHVLSQDDFLAWIDRLVKFRMKN